MGFINHEYHPLISRDMRGRLPKLRLVAPLTWAICWIFVFINTFIAYALAFIYKPVTPLAVVNHFVSFQFWAVVFFLLTAFATYFLVNNNWRGTRWMLFIGLIVKFFWLVALIIRTFESPTSTILLTVMWTCFALVQAATFIWFLPSLQIGRSKDNV